MFLVILEMNFMLFCLWFVRVVLPYPAFQDGGRATLRSAGDEIFVITSSLKGTFENKGKFSTNQTCKSDAEFKKCFRWLLILLLCSHVALWVSRSPGREKERGYLSCLLKFVLTNQKTVLKGRLLKGKRSLIVHVCSTKTVELFQNSRRLS